MAPNDRGAAVESIHSYSFVQCREDENILVFEYVDGEGTVISNNDNSIHQMISYDDSYVYVDREKFEDFCAKNNAIGDI